MNRHHLLLSAAVLLASASVAGAQDARAKTSLKLPSHDPVVADAAERGDLAAVKAALAKGADVNLAQGDGMTALGWAAERGDSALTATLVAAHANVKATTRIGSYTPLQIAAKSGNASVVEQLIKAGSDVRATTTSGATALHFAASAGNPAAVAALIEHGADVNAREAIWGQTPLVFAAEKNRAEALKVLLKHGANPSIHTKMVDVVAQAALDQAVTKRRNEVLISYEPEKHKDSAKVVAAAPGAAQPAMAGMAMGKATAPTSLDSAVGAAGTAKPGAKPGDANDPAAYLPADVADATARAFGRAPKGPQPKGPFTSAQIQTAIDSGRAVLTRPVKLEKVVEKVDTINGGVAGYAASVGGVGGLSALHHAVRQGNLDAVIALLDGGANINDTSDVDHTTPLLMATLNGQYDVAMELIKRKADPNIPSKINVTPLYATINTQWAPKSRYPQPQALQSQKTTYLQVMEALLKAGAQPNVRLTANPWYFTYNNCGNANCGLENLEGTTAFWRATYAVDLDAMKLLVKYGADVTLPSHVTKVAGRGGRGGGPGGAGGAGGAGGGRGFIAPPGMPNLPGIDSLAKAAPVGLGVYPIDAAAGVGYGNGFAGNSHRHAPDGWMPVMRYLVEVLHADVNQRDENGYTPLHHAASRGDNEMILYLVAHGADVKAVAKNGRTVVDMANGPVQRVTPLPQTIALLEKLGAVNQHHCVSC